MIDMREYGQTLCLNGGFEPAHRFLRAGGAAYRYHPSTAMAGTPLRHVNTIKMRVKPRAARRTRRTLPIMTATDLQGAPV
jgi:hypothetical protein